MRTRLLPTIVLIVYSVILIKVVVFKGLTRDVPPGRPPGGPRGDRALPIIRSTPQRTAESRGNFVPFKTILPQLRGQPNWPVAIMNLGGNTVLFMPIGILMPLVYRRMTWLKSLALAVAVGLAMEGMEGLFRVGIVDVDDVILNALGVMTGYGVFRIFQRRKRNAPSVNETADLNGKRL